MMEILLIIIGLLIGSICVYFYMRNKNNALGERILDELVKSRLMKEELGRKTKKFNGPKKRYYNNRKNKNGKSK